ncbi:PIR Superfamily Protein [Plasmodium ovale curtisi]|uniref:PIR Superfamily Protein n=2 Tax=Plasmodium ovale curtisi TaxID=864141 RepID=A0A1A8WM80_PLAOA|nr:PIR Superfamily Protein [Plasmodium ovale curtisi]
MSLEIPTIYNVASSYKEYKNELDTYKGHDVLMHAFDCDAFNNEFLRKSGGDVFRICYAVMNFLNLLMEKDNSYKDKGSKYLFHWLHVDVLGNKYPIQDTIILYKELHEKFNNEEGDNTLYKYINQINVHTSEQIVKLISIYDKLEHFNSEYVSKKEKVSCTGECIDLYNTYVDECRKGYDKDFCNELKNFREKYHFFIRKILSYEGEQYLLPPVESFNTLGVIIIPFTLILVTSLSFPIFYKFTTFGPWIHRIIGKNNNIWENIKEETNHSLNPYEMENKNSENRSYNISYDSL